MVIAVAVVWFVCLFVADDLVLFVCLCVCVLLLLLLLLSLLLFLFVDHHVYSLLLLFLL